MPEQPNPEGGLRGLRRTMRAPIDKAARLISEDRVTRLPSARVYEVRGDSHTYHVVASPEGIFCPCQASTPLCSHVLAVAHLTTHDEIAHGNGSAQLQVLP